ncbi:MAG: hypothetical protein AAF580_00185 [Pseudomonadota bacterium]
MSVIYTEEEIIAEVPGLDRTLLLRFVGARIVIPVARAPGPQACYLPVDVARVRLACELCESFDFEDDALGVVMGLVDRLHATRADLQAVLEAVGELPDAHRQMVAKKVRQKRSPDAG